MRAARPPARRRRPARRRDPAAALRARRRQHAAARGGRLRAALRRRRRGPRLRRARARGRRLVPSLHPGALAGRLTRGRRDERGAARETRRRPRRSPTSCAASAAGSRRASTRSPPPSRRPGRCRRAARRDRGDRAAACGATTTRTSGASTRSSPRPSSRSSSSSTTSGGGSRPRACATCPSHGRGAARRQPRRLAVPLRRDDDHDGDHEAAPAAALAAVHGPRLGLRAALPLLLHAQASAASRRAPYNATRLLEQDELVMVFPEGVKGTGKPFSERYRLQRFGRGGFVEIALRTGSPIVPVAVVGSEEIYPKIAESPALARLLGAPVRPDHPDLPLARAARADPAALALADRVLRADRPLRATPPEAAEDRRSSSSSPSRCARRSRRSSTRTWSSAALGVPLSPGNRLARGMEAATARRRDRGPGRRYARRDLAPALEQALAASDADERIGPADRGDRAADAVRVPDAAIVDSPRRRRGRAQPALVVRRAAEWGPKLSSR